MIKTEQSVYVKGMFFNIIKAVYVKPIINIILNIESWKLFL